MTPQQLRASVVEALWQDDSLDAHGIRVEVVGRDVWLQGEVTTPDMYDLAEHIAAQVHGVGDLTNNLVCTEEPYDIAAHRNGMDLREEPSTDVNSEGRLLTRLDRFGDESDEAISPEGEEEGGPVGGDSGENIHPMDLNEVAPLASDSIHAEEPWRYQSDGVNAHLEVEPVLPPDDNEV
ncbi:MAG TPA: BON domain-containing protein [Armatimonadota bacterium]